MKKRHGFLGIKKGIKKGMGKRHGKRGM